MGSVANGNGAMMKKTNKNVLFTLNSTEKYAKKKMIANVEAE